MNIHINFSLDSLTDGIYETIRVNAKLRERNGYSDFFSNALEASSDVLYTGL